jgi:hypothetical protein
MKKCKCGEGAAIYPKKKSFHPPMCTGCYLRWVEEGPVIHSEGSAAVSVLFATVLTALFVFLTHFLH